MKGNESYNTLNWRPSPKFILRRNAIRYITRYWPAGCFLEMGAGTGTMSRVFLDRGFIGLCHDLSERTLQILSFNLREYGNQVSVTNNIDDYPDDSFDYLFAFEVLEHIYNDLNSLIVWSKKLRNGGKLLISVPAHQGKYSMDDEFVGHVRRYDKIQLYSLINNAGFTNIQIYNYGFPIGNITGWVSRTFRLSGRKRSGMSLLDRSIQSGIQRSDAVKKTGLLFNDSTLFPFSIMQRFFFQRDHGDGYIAIGEKRGACEHPKQDQQER